MTEKLNFSAFRNSVLSEVKDKQTQAEVSQLRASEQDV